MPKTKKPLNPRVILQKLQERRYSYRGIAAALDEKCFYPIDQSLLNRIANGKRPCSDELAAELNRLWRLEP